jgi:hypothetical protein
MSLCLVAAIDDGNMGLNVLLQQPRQELAASVSLVRSQILWPNSKLAQELEHPSSSQHFLAEARRRGIDRQNHSARRVYQIVVVVSEGRWPAFDRPRSI